MKTPRGFRNGNIYRTHTLYVYTVYMFIFINYFITHAIVSYIYIYVSVTPVIWESASGVFNMYNMIFIHQRVEMLIERERERDAKF